MYVEISAYEEEKKWEVSPLHLCLCPFTIITSLGGEKKEKGNSSYKASPLTGANTTSRICLVQSCSRSIIPRMGSRSLFRQHTAQAATAWFAKLRIFIRELKQFPSVPMLLKATGM